MFEKGRHILRAGRQEDAFAPADRFGCRGLHVATMDAGMPARRRRSLVTQIWNVEFTGQADELR